MLAERHSMIALVIWKCSQQCSLVMLHAFDTAHITDKVFSVIVWYFKPFFIGQILYLFQGVYLLSLLLEKYQKSIIKV